MKFIRSLWYIDKKVIWPHVYTWEINVKLGRLEPKPNKDNEEKWYGSQSPGY